MRMFWTAFFLGSLLLIGLDVTERRQSPRTQPEAATMESDGVPVPTPRM